jgi:PAS domain S-box-containing protein
LAESDASSVGTADLLEIIDLVDVAACAWDRDLNLTYVNDRYRRLFNVDAARIHVGMPLQELFELSLQHGKIGIVTSRAGQTAEIDKIRNLRTQEVTQHFSKDGRLFKRIRQPMANGGGCVILRDITGSQGATTNRTVNLVRQILNYFPGGCVLYSPDDRIVACNAAFAAIYNAETEELVGKSFADVIQAGDRSNSGFKVEPGTVGPRCRSSGMTSERFTVRSRDGRHFLIEENLLPDGHLVSFRTDISDVTVTGEAIRRSVDAPSDVQRFNRLGVWTFSMSDDKLEWSDEQYRIYGYEPGEIEPSKEVFRSHLMPDEITSDEAVVKTGFSRNLKEQWAEFRIRRNDGEIRWLSSHRQFYYDESGNPVRVSGVTQDITERKLIEEEVRQGREILRNAIESMDSAFRLVGPDGCLVTYNQKFLEIYPEIADLVAPGVPVETLRRAYHERTGKLYRSTGPDEHRYGSLQPLKRFETRTPSGVWIRVAESQTPDGGLVSVITDISANKAIERRLADSESRFRTFTEISSDWFWEAAYDETGTMRYRHFSSRFYELTGLLPEQVEGKEPGSLPIREPIHVDGTTLREVIEDGLPIKNFVVSFLGADGGRLYIRMHARPVFDSKGNVTRYLGTGEDITKEREREIELRDARDQAEHANRAKSEFLASMSHELRTPLNAIIGFSEATLAAIHGPLGHERYNEYLADIHSSGEHLLNLINDILDLSKVESEAWKPHFEATSLPNTITRAIRLFGQQASESGIEIITEQQNDITEFFADSRALLQILVNLVSNAVKFTPSGGRITISTRRAGDQVVLKVADTGVGIPEADIKRVMEPFEQVENVMSRTHQGTGLGLSIVKALAAAHGGSFKLESRPGAGTSATVRLPLQPVHRSRI